MPNATSPWLSNFCLNVPCILYSGSIKAWAFWRRRYCSTWNVLDQGIVSITSHLDPRTLDWPWRRHTSQGGTFPQRTGQNPVFVQKLYSTSTTAGNADVSSNEKWKVKRKVKVKMIANFYIWYFRWDVPLIELDWSIFSSFYWSIFVWTFCISYFYVSLFLCGLMDFSFFAQFSIKITIFSVQWNTVLQIYTCDQ